MTPVGRLRLAYLLLLVTPALWAVNYLSARLSVGIVAPHVLALGRWAIAGGLLTLLAWTDISANRAAFGREWKRLAVFGFLGMWICGTFVYIGGRSTSATNIGLLYAISPVLIALGSTLFLKERMGPVQLVGVALALAGVVHVVLKGQWAALAQVSFVAGDLWILGAALSWAAYALLLKAWPSSYGDLARLALSCWGGVAALIPLAIIEAAVFIPSDPGWKTFGLMALTALFPGVGAYLAYGFMQRVLGAARVGVVLYLGPLYTAAMAAMVLDEPVYPFHLVGAALTLPGLYLATRPARASPRS